MDSANEKVSGILLMFGTSFLAIALIAAWVFSGTDSGDFVSLTNGDDVTPQMQSPQGESIQENVVSVPSEPVDMTFDARIDDHLASLKERMPPGDFNVILQDPFVVIGDQTPDEVRSGARTVEWAVNCLKQDYFTKDPNEIIDVWLFKDEESYYVNAEKLFGSKPTTMYGYYTPTHNALVMNISTGGGTLVHEIVHPFIESNFPQCPSWFNEGLASLYEQSSELDGKIIGNSNWRLRALQLAIKDGIVPSFEELCSTTRREFYSEKATNYAQARYLCQYLQERKLLRTYYHEFNKNVADDPTGYETLKRVLNVEDMDAFKDQWEAFVMKLRYP